MAEESIQSKDKIKYVAVEQEKIKNEENVWDFLCIYHHDHYTLQDAILSWKAIFFKLNFISKII